MSKEQRINQGICPQCGSDNLQYAAIEPEGEGIYYPYTCQNCDFSGEEYYDLSFAGHKDHDTGEFLSMASCTDKMEVLITEQCSELPRKKLAVNVMAEHGKLWIQPDGYSDKTSAEGQGWPIGLEIWERRLRLIVFGNINVEDPQIIDLENAREDARISCNWCSKDIGSTSVKWKELLFCSDACLDECRAAQ